MVITNKTIFLEYRHYLYILEECIKWAPKETGGIIMGYNKTDQYWVTDIIGPGSKARHELYTFNPDNEFHEKEMARVYNDSGRIHTYLGDWHTHPNNKSYLSELDKKTLRNISSNPECQLPEPLMFILGTAPLELKAWIYQPRNLFAYKHPIIKLVKSCM